MAALSADGRFYPCHRFTGSEAHAMGDIDGRFPDRKMFASHIVLENPKCRNCPARYACGAPCPYISACDAEEEEGVRPEFRAPETYCRLMKMKLMMRAVLADRLSGEDRRWIAGAVFRAEDA
jgi:radical SAM protein with 4Fe4S-binding SPASM domain